MAQTNEKAQNIIRLDFVFIFIYYVYVYGNIKTRVIIR